MSIILSTSAVRATAGELESAQLLDDYVKMMDNISNRYKLYLLFFREMPTNVQKQVGLFETGAEKHFVNDKVVSMELLTVKNHSYSFVRCSEYNLWFMSAQNSKDLNDPIFIFSDNFFKEVFFKDFYWCYFKYENDMIHFKNNDYVGINFLDAEKKEHNTNVSCFSFVDVANTEGSCSFNSLFYALLTDKDIRAKMHRASEQLIALNTQSRVPNIVLEAISFFDEPKKFIGKCAVDNFLKILFEESPETNKDYSYETETQFYLMMRYFSRLYSPVLSICNFSQQLRAKKDADILYKSGSIETDVNLVEIIQGVEYELIGVYVTGPEHAMSISRCEFDPTFWQFHDAFVSEDPSRCFMFRGTDISFFGKNKKYSFGFAYADVVPHTIFYKKKNSAPEPLRENSKLEQSCEHNFFRILEQKLNKCENTFMETLFGNTALRTFIQQSISPEHIKNKSDILRRTHYATGWFDNNMQTVCPVNMEISLKNKYIMPYAEVLKKTPSNEIVKNAIRKKRIDFLLHIFKNEKNVSLNKQIVRIFIQDAIAAYVDLYEKEESEFPPAILRQFILAILTGFDPYEVTDKRSIIETCIKDGDSELYQRLFILFQNLQPGLAQKKLLYYFHLPNDSDTLGFCERYDVLNNEDAEYRYDNKNDKSSARIIGPVIEKTEPEKYAALYTLFKSVFTEMYVLFSNTNYIQFFESERLEYNRGVFLITRKLLYRGYKKKARDFNSLCDQPLGLLFFEDNGADELHFNYLSGMDTDQTTAIEMLIEYAKEKKYKKLVAMERVTEDSNEILTNLQFSFEKKKDDETKTIAFLML